jgi:hypothetical protein
MIRLLGEIDANAETRRLLARARLEGRRATDLIFRRSSRMKSAIQPRGRGRTPPPSPIFLKLALHRWRIGILGLDPVARRTPDVT